MANTIENNDDSVVATKYNLNEMKIHCDEALQKFFEKQGYKEYHRHTDVKLVLGYSACLLAAFEFAYTWKKPFEETWYPTLFCVIGFAILSILATTYGYLVQKDAVYVGSKTVNNKSIVLSASSTVTPGDEHYHLTFTVQSLNGDTAPRSQTFSPSLGAWFYESGKLERSALEKDVGEFVSAVVGKKLE
ncbi:hypothetical protein IWQ60_008643 [Tieghemiomyces parasiticus]|uniref:Signal peptidase complex subunit 2 n=1 Tax=Tieghemiomyces parasiticus TaxID=78921 RepID=A0A9W7ZWV8_9FUNG|nr:hypothetical protein IWQ60_008643 [Tieghemiomyces parasiticus]